MNSTYTKCSNKDFSYFGVGNIKTMPMQKPEAMARKTCLFFSYHIDGDDEKRRNLKGINQWLKNVCLSDIT